MINFVARHEDLTRLSCCSSELGITVAATTKS
jgi:hypothetical protein